MKTLATFFGQNLVNPDAYKGWSGNLSGCVWDASNWAVWATQFARGGEQDSIAAVFSERRGQRQPGFIGQFPPYTPHYGATCQEFRYRLSLLTGAAREGDLVLIGVSGHGTTYATLGESDLTGEALCFADGLVTDAELRTLLCEFRAGVRVLVFLDTCFSGGMDRAGWVTPKAAPPQLIERAPEAPKSPPDVSVLIFGACGENQTAGDTPLGGVWSLSALSAWHAYEQADLAVVTPERWHADTIEFSHEHWTKRQTPTLTALGPDISTQRFFA